MPLVKIKPGLSHGYRAADGSHAYHQAGDEFDASPAEIEAFGDKFEPAGEDPEQDVRKVSPAAGNRSELLAGINATKGALKLAAEHGVSLVLLDIVGTGAGERIVKADVETLLADGDTEWRR